MIQTCNNCKYSDLARFEAPCRDCYDRSNWKPEDRTECIGYDESFCEARDCSECECFEESDHDWQINVFIKNKFDPYICRHVKNYMVNITTGFLMICMEGLTVNFNLNIVDYFIIDETVGGAK